MDYRIVSKPPFAVIGYVLRTSVHDGSNHREIPAFWQQYLRGELGPRLPGPAPGVMPIELGVCTNMDRSEGAFDYVIGTEWDSGSGAVPDGLKRLELPAETYLVFTTPPAPPETFSPTIQATWGRIFEWLPGSGYAHSGGADFELYDERSAPDYPGGLRMDIYIPVRPVAQQVEA